MNDFYANLKSFEYNGKTIYYNIKDIDIRLKPIKGVEKASAYMDIFDENHNAIDVFQVYDEKNLVIYGMPSDAKRWYEEYLNDKKY